MVYEIFLGEKDLPAKMWREFLDQIADLHANFQKWRIVMLRENEKIHYYIDTPIILSANSGTENFYLVKSEDEIDRIKFCKKVLLAKENFVKTDAYLTAQKKQKIEKVEINFGKIFSKSIADAKIQTNKNFLRFFCDVAEFLAINFERAKQFTCMSMPKFLDAQKILANLHENNSTAIMEVESFPYQVQENFLGVKNFDLDKHALVLGASGSGKSKFLSMLVEKVTQDETLAQQFHFLVIDPHAALVNEIGKICKVIDFENEAVDLFAKNNKSKIVATELQLEVFKGMLATSWNSRLERVLRHSFAVLLTAKKMSFSSLRKLLLDLDFRNEILEEVEKECQNSVDFFLMEYSEIKSRNYDGAIAPIITMLDEIGMVPVFENEKFVAKNLEDLANENVATILSLDRTRMGKRGVELVAGMIMQQAMTMMQSGNIKQKLILIVDEVAVVANPVLAQLLAEARKYGLTVILAGQYFGAIPEYLREAIVANAVNYFLFRVSRDDAILLSQIVDMKIPLDETLERKIKTLCELNNREMVMRVSIENELQPAVKARTLDFAAREKDATQEKTENIFGKKNLERKTLYIMYDFSVETSFTLSNILQKTSVTRKNKGEMSMEKRLIKSLEKYSQREFNNERK